MLNSQKQLKKLTIRFWAGIFLMFIMLVASIIIFSNLIYNLKVQAFTTKSTGGILTAQEWNDLQTDFVIKSGDTMTGPLIIQGDITANRVCDTASNCLDTVGPTLGATLYDTSSYFGCSTGGPTEGPTNSNYGIANGCTCRTGRLTTSSSCTYNSWMSGGNNHRTCVYSCSLNSAGRLVQ